MWISGFYVPRWDFGSRVLRCNCLSYGHNFCSFQFSMKYVLLSFFLWGSAFSQDQGIELLTSDAFRLLSPDYWQPSLSRESSVEEVRERVRELARQTFWETDPQLKGDYGFFILRLHAYLHLIRHYYKLRPEDRIYTNSIVKTYNLIPLVIGRADLLPVLDSFVKEFTAGLQENNSSVMIATIKKFETQHPNDRDAFYFIFRGMYEKQKTSQKKLTGQVLQFINYRQCGSLFL